MAKPPVFQDADKHFVQLENLPEVAYNNDPRQGKIFQQPDYSAPIPIGPAHPGHRPQNNHPFYNTSGLDHEGKQTVPQHSVRTDRTVCGIRRRLFCILLAVVLVVLLIGAGLGAGLGIGLRRNGTDSAASNGTGNGSGSGGSGGSGTSPDNPRATDANGRPTNNTNSTTSPSGPLQVVFNSGLASTLRGDGAGMLLYYQDSDGKVIEEFHPNANLTSQQISSAAPVGIERNVVNTAQIADGTQLSATSYELGGVVWKHLFYNDLQGFTRLTNTSGSSGRWSDPGILKPEAQRSDASSLSSCFSSDGGNTLHVFFGGRDGLVYEAYNALDDSGSGPWTLANNGRYIFQGTSSRGCACGVFRQGGTKRVVLFSGNNSDSNLMHLYRDADPEGPWTVVDEDNLEINGPRRVNVSLKHNMALVPKPDRSVTFLYFRGEDGAIKQLTYPGDVGGQYSSWRSWDQVDLPINTKLTAVWPESQADAPVVFYQNYERRNQVQVSVVGPNGDIIANSTLGA